MNISSFPIMHERHSNESLLVKNALVFIVENHFQKLAPAFVLTLMCLKRLSCHYFNDLLGQFLQNCETLPKQIVRVSDYNEQNVSGLRDVNLIFVDSFESFRAIDFISYTDRYDYNEYYYIILARSDHFYQNDMAKIFKYCWKYYLINCNIQLHNAKGEILIYTYYPFTPKRCGKITIKRINQYRNGRLANKALFPNKLLNFHHCPLRAAMWNVPPYVYMKTFDNGSGHLEQGIETRLVKDLAQKLNFTIVVKVPFKSKTTEKKIESSHLGAIKMVAERKADFACGCFSFSTQLLEFVTPTFSYYQTAQIICVPVAAFEFTSLEILLFPFKASTWFFILAISTIIIALIWLVKKHQRFYPQLMPVRKQDQNAYLNVFLIALGMPSIDTPQRVFAKMLYITWIVATLLLRTGYQALLYHLIRTHPISKLPTTMEDLLAKNYTIAITINSYFTIQNASFTSQLNFRILNSTKTTVAFEYAERKGQRKFLAAGNAAALAYYEEKFGKKNVFRKLNENLINLKVTMYLSKHSYLVGRFNEVILNMRSSGLLQAALQKEIDFRFINKRDLTEEQPWILKHIYVVFVMLIIGHFVASLVFLIEFSMV